MLNRMRLLVRSLLLRRRLESEMKEEMTGHLERATARFVARGYSENDARREAEREFGNVTSLQEQGRIARGGRWLDALAADSRFALRQFIRNPGATLAMLVVLSVGMSISTSLFSFLHAFSRQPPLGVAQRDDLVRVLGTQMASEGKMIRRFTYAELQEYQGLTSHFADVAGWTNIGVTIDREGSGEPRVHPATATFVTDNYFSVLGVQPIIGRDLPTSAGTTTELSAIISYGVWEELFARSPSAIGARLGVEGIAFTVVGVAPPKFAGLNVFSDLKVFLPVSTRRLVMPGQRDDSETFGAAARLNPGVSHLAATTAAQVVAARVAPQVEQPAGEPADREPSVDVVPMLATNGDPQFEQDMRMLTLVFAGLGLLVLLVTCTNVSALQTGLAMNRRREIAIRLSMGAARTRIVRQLLTESVILATIAGTAALGLVWMIQRVVMSRVPDMPIEIVVSGPAAAFTFGIALAAGVLFGLSPALHATRLTVGSVLKDATATIAAPRARLQRALVVAQIAFTQPLIVGLAVMLFVLSSEFERLGLNDSAEQIVFVRLRSTTPASGVSADPAAAREEHQAMRQLRDRLRVMPGVAGAVENTGVTLSLDGYAVYPDDRVAGGLEGSLRITAPVVAPGYFAVMGIPLVLGRDFTETEFSLPSDRARTVIPVVIGAHLARALWPGASPVGRRLQPAADAGRPGHTFSVVGVVDQPGDARRDASDGYRVYLPPDSTSVGSAPLAMMVRSTGDAQSLIPIVRATVREEVPRLSIGSVRTVAEMEADLRHGFATVAAVLGGAGLMTLMLAAIGLYAVVAFAVGQRTAEIAVRMAVGAEAHQIVRRFIGDGIRLGAIGLMVGLPLSLVVLRQMLTADVLPSVPFAPVAGIAALGVLLVALSGTWIPARRAAGVDPARILRQD